jgi:hypothetical protein
MILNRDEVKQIFGVDYYDGSQIHSRLAYKCFRDKVVPIGNIVAFRSPTTVTTNLIDLEDAITKDYIHSADMINFCFELPLSNLWGGVAFQRLYNSMIADVLAKTIQAPIEVSGDDIFVCKEFTQGGIIQTRGKASVSIVCERQGAILGHTGINIVAGKEAPAFAYSTNMTNEQAEKFMKECIEVFYRTVNSVFIATSKVI